MLKKAQLKRRQTVVKTGGQSVTAARAELAKASKDAHGSAGDHTGGDDGVRSRNRRRMAALMKESALHQDSLSAYADWPFMTGWMLKKGRKRTNWKQRWFVLAGPFLLYYDSPEAQISHTVLDDNFAFLKGFELITNKQLRAGSCEIRSYKVAQVQRTVQNHPDCFVLQDADRELFLDPPPQSARSHSTAEWVRRLRKGIEMADQVQTQAVGMQMLLAQGSGGETTSLLLAACCLLLAACCLLLPYSQLVGLLTCNNLLPYRSGLAPTRSTMAMTISDACLPRVFRETLLLAARCSLLAARCLLRVKVALS